MGKKSQNTLFKWTVIWTDSLWDFFSDILFAQEVWLWHGKENTDISLILFAVSISFLVIPWSMNMYNILVNTKKIESHFQDNPPAQRWFRRHAKGLGFLVSLSGGIFPVIQLVNSRCFGMEYFTMGLSRTEILSFLEYKVKLNIFGENLPQLMVQIAFVYFDPSNIGNIATWIAMFSSILSILSALLSYRLNKSIQNNVTNRYTITLTAFKSDQNNNQVNSIITKDLQRIERMSLLHHRLLRYSKIQFLYVCLNQNSVINKQNIKMNNTVLV